MQDLTPQLKSTLDRLYTSYDHPESALDPIQIVRRYERLDDEVATDLSMLKLLRRMAR